MLCGEKTWLLSTRSGSGLTVSEPRFFKFDGGVMNSAHGKNIEGLPEHG